MHSCKLGPLRVWIDHCPCRQNDNSPRISCVGGLGEEVQAIGSTAINIYNHLKKKKKKFMNHREQIKSPRKSSKTALI